MIDVSITTLKPKIKRNNLEISINRGAAAIPKNFKFLDRKTVQEKLNKVIKKADDVRCSKGDATKIKSNSSLMKKELAKFGTYLFKTLKETNKKEKFKDIFFGLDDSSLQLKLDNGTRMYPWELMFDGKNFLCNKYAIGRMIFTENIKFYGGEHPHRDRALVVGLNYEENCRKDLEELKYPEKEAKIIAKRFENIYDTKLLVGEEATVKNMSKELSKGVDIFHFTGHGFFKYRAKSAEQSAGICLADNDMNRAEFSKVFDKARGAPFLSFMNACGTAREKGGKHTIEINDPYGLAETFIQYGAEAYIGSFWSIDDKISYRFCKEFYDILKRKTIGESLMKTRLSFKSERSKAAIDTWPAYVLFGNPTAGI